ncbi:putative quinol monooxygenase [Pseudomonas sp. 18175]|uniref:putative quinol monooxygenase n=1 Tax=Pseudomonas sp. 18175 TaxID=3390056 RepID=UPI003D1D91E8
MTKHIDLIVTLQAHDGSEQALKEVLDDLQKDSLSEDGCLHYRIAQTVPPSNVMLLQERWASTEAHKYHESTPHFISGVERISPLCLTVEIQQVNWADG